MDVIYEYENQICAAVVVASVLAAMAALMWDDK